MLHSALEDGGENLGMARGGSGEAGIVSRHAAGVLAPLPKLR